MSGRVTVSGGAVLLLGVLIFVLRPAELAALLLAAAAHEVGHLAALLLLRGRVRGVAFTVSGPVIRCDVPPRAAARCLAALAGPAAGIGLFWALRARYPLAAELSLLLSGVNLLPVLPLDGGRVLQAALEGLCGARSSLGALEALGFFVPVALMALGLCAVRVGYGLSVVAFGAWLLLLQPESLVNPAGMM